MTERKILTDGELRREIPKQFYRDRIILATGCFDVLHPGHVKLLEAALASRPGGLLWVGLNSDLAVRNLKGYARPINAYRDRAIVIAALACVDRVFEIDDVRVAAAIELVSPLAWVKGGDYTIRTLDKSEVEAANHVGAGIIILPTVGDYSTTKILSKI